MGLGIIRRARKVLASRFKGDQPEDMASMTEEQKTYYTDKVNAYTAAASAKPDTKSKAKKSPNKTFLRALGTAISGFGDAGESEEIRELVKACGLTKQFGHALLFACGDITINPDDDGDPHTPRTIPALQGDDMRHAAFVKLCERLAISLATEKTGSQ